MKSTYIVAADRGKCVSIDGIGAIVILIVLVWLIVYV